MRKLYRYRPNSEFLFKELFYQEIYFASYDELNDPLDLSARMEFTPKDVNSIDCLVNLIIKAHFDYNESQKPSDNLVRVVSFLRDKEAWFTLMQEIYRNSMAFLEEENKIWTEDIEWIIKSSIKKTKTDLDFDSKKFRDEIERLTKKFLKNSYVACFSETHNDYLMWSHYASKHYGICLEFSSENFGQFPYEFTEQRPNNKEYHKRGFTNLETKSTIYWSGLMKVNYEDEQPFINFYKFSPVFENEHDCDLIGLSKSWTHEYAHELKWVFSTKTKSWKYENEWRDIQINFDKAKEPEERISKYPIECLSAIYFGIKTPQNVRNRIYKIFLQKHANIKFYEPKLNGTDMIEFEEWEFIEE